MSEAIILKNYIKENVEVITPTPHTITISANQNWTVPNHYGAIDVLIFGGGGGGSQVFGLHGPSSFGCGGGGWMNNRSLYLTNGSRVTITIGSGGSLGASGGTSSFGTWLSAAGGSAGSGSGNGGSGGSGGAGINGGRGYQFGGGGGIIRGGNGGPYGGGGGATNANYVAENITNYGFYTNNNALYFNSNSTVLHTFSGTSQAGTGLNSGTTSGTVVSFVAANGTTLRISCGSGGRGYTLSGRGGTGSLINIKSTSSSTWGPTVINILRCFTIFGIGGGGGGYRMAGSSTGGGGGYSSTYNTNTRRAGGGGGYSSYAQGGGFRDNKSAIVGDEAYGTNGVCVITYYTID